jgi:hypothetical protein
MTTEDQAHAYQERILAAVTDAIVEASIRKASDGQRVAVLLSAEIVDALVTVQASMLATSPSASSPTSLRRLCDKYAKRLFSRIRAGQENPELRKVFTDVHTHDPERTN